MKLNKGQSQEKEKAMARALEPKAPATEPEKNSTSVTDETVTETFAPLEVKAVEPQSPVKAVEVPKAPRGFTVLKGGNCCHEGKSYEADENGHLIVPNELVKMFVEHGLERV